MTDSIIIAVIGLLGSGIGSLGGILISSKLTQFRLLQLENKVEQLSAVVERTYKLEDQNNLWAEKFKVINHRLDDIERKLDREE